MKKIDFKKIFVGVFAAAFVSTILAVAFTTMAFRTNPDFLQQLGNQVGANATKGKNYQELAEEDLNGVNTVSIKSIHGDLDIKSYEGSTLKIEYYGKIPENETGKFIGVDRQGDQLSIELNRPQERTSFSLIWDESAKGLVFSDSSLNARIYIPKKFSQTLEVQSLSGDLHLTDVHCGTLKMKSTNGDTELQGIQCQDVMAKLTNGDFHSEGSKAKNWDVKNSHGDIVFALPEGSVYQFDLSTAHGDVHNSANMTAPPQAKDVGTIHAKTASGDIRITKYIEGAEDND